MHVCANWQSSMHCKTVFLRRSLILSREKDPRYLYVAWKRYKVHEKTFYIVHGSIDSPRPYQSVGFDGVMAWKLNNLHMDSYRPWNHCLHGFWITTPVSVSFWTRYMPASMFILPQRWFYENFFSLSDTFVDAWTLI